MTDDLSGDGFGLRHRWSTRPVSRCVGTSCRSYVRQRYPSLQQHKVIYRGPFIKGDTGKSLVVGGVVRGLLCSRPQLPSTTLRQGRQHEKHVRFWERNGSGGRLSGVVRSGHRAWLNSPDVRKRAAAAVLPGDALSSHRGDQRFDGSARLPSEESLRPAADLMPDTCRNRPDHQ